MKKTILTTALVSAAVLMGGHSTAWGSNSIKLGLMTGISTFDDAKAHTLLQGTLDKSVTKEEVQAVVEHNLEPDTFIDSKKQVQVLAAADQPTLAQHVNLLKAALSVDAWQSVNTVKANASLEEMQAAKLWSTTQGALDWTAFTDKDLEAATYLSQHSDEINYDIQAHNALKCLTTAQHGAAALAIDVITANQVKAVMQVADLVAVDGTLGGSVEEFVWGIQHGLRDGAAPIGTIPNLLLKVIHVDGGANTRTARIVWKSSGLDLAGRRITTDVAEVKTILIHNNNLMTGGGVVRLNQANLNDYFLAQDLGNDAVNVNYSTVLTMANHF
jgi:hypothetical protein